MYIINTLRDRSKVSLNTGNFRAARIKWETNGVSVFPYLGSLPVPVRTTRRRFSARINWIFWNSNLDGCNPIGGELIAPYRETHVAFSNIVHSSACNVSRDISSRWRDLEEKSAPFTGWRTRRRRRFAALFWQMFREIVPRKWCTRVKAKFEFLSSAAHASPRIPDSKCACNSDNRMCACVRVWFHLLFSHRVLSVDGWVGSWNWEGYISIASTRLYTCLRGNDVV